MKKKVFRDKYYNLDKLPNEVIIIKTEEGIKVEPVVEEKAVKKTTKKKKSDK